MFASVGTLVLVIPTAVYFCKKRVNNAAGDSEEGTHFVNTSSLISIDDLDLRDFEGKNPVNDPSFGKMEFFKADPQKDYQDQHLADVFRNTLDICNEEGFRSDFDNYTVYALDNCIHGIEGDKILKKTIHKVPGGKKRGYLCINDGNSVGGVYDSVREEHLGKVAVTDFANYSYPGGAPMNGSRAQEENLCRIMDLANRLWYKKTYNQFYGVNKCLIQKKKIGKFSDHRALYLRNVWLLKEDNDEYTLIAPDKRKRMDVVVIAAPDLREEVKQLSKCGHKSKDECRKVISNMRGELIKDRIRLVFETAIDNDIDTIGFGAFGCGVFDCDPDEVARLSREILIDEGYLSYFDNVVINIPRTSEKGKKNFDAFAKAFKTHAELKCRN